MSARHAAIGAYIEIFGNSAYDGCTGRSTRDVVVYGARGFVALHQRAHQDGSKFWRAQSGRCLGFGSTADKAVKMLVHEVRSEAK